MWHETRADVPDINYLIGLDPAQGQAEGQVGPEKMQQGPAALGISVKTATVLQVGSRRRIGQLLVKVANLLGEHYDVPAS